MGNRIASPRSADPAFRPSARWNCAIALVTVMVAVLGARQAVANSPRPDAPAASLESLLRLAEARATDGEVRTNSDRVTEPIVPLPAQRITPISRADSHDIRVPGVTRRTGLVFRLRESVSESRRSSTREMRCRDGAALTKLACL